MNKLAVIFDLDGVLIDSEAAHLQSWKDLAAELGQPFDEALFLGTFGRRNAEIIPILFGAHRTPDENARLAARKEVIYRQSIRGRVPAIDGAVELVRACAAYGFAIALGSSAPWENAELVLEEMAIRDYFGAVVTDRDVKIGKPDPGVFLTGAQRLGVPPRNCAVVEDAPAGLQAAKAAGMTAVALAGTHPRDGLGRADLIVDSLRILSPAQISELIAP